MYPLFLCSANSPCFKNAQRQDEMTTHTRTAQSVSHQNKSSARRVSQRRSTESRSNSSTARHASNNHLERFKQFQQQHVTRGPVARGGNRSKQRSTTTGPKNSTVGSSRGFLSNIKNLGKKLALGWLKFKGKNTFVGAIAALGGYINRLNYRQGTRMGNGTCGLCSGSNIATAIKMMQERAKGGRKGLQHFAKKLRALKLPKKLEYAMMRYGRHIRGGGTTHGDQMGNMKKINTILGGMLGFKKNIYGGATRGTTNLLDKVLGQGRLAQINIRSGGLWGKGSMLGHWRQIDHAIMIAGMRLSKNGRKQYAVVDSSGARAGKGVQWINESKLTGGRFDITYTKPITDLIG